MCSQILVRGKTSFIGSKVIPAKAGDTTLQIVFLQLIGKWDAFLEHIFKIQQMACQEIWGMSIKVSNS